ncbi:FAD-binding protein [Stenotrophobium rhamnosiphilum]|uniref:FAD-binding protein n=1 Tax=Stenotrophobium rhamnosiphilum TaxID=2029166 RepID=A0A2T5MG80_9GAMM|nr:FAD-binding protein [Stenotrophobium rhamnosiphilum]PTU31572.1 FAD-binding protein [Stenotrophobium rhamnosiphilum]
MSQSSNAPATSADGTLHIEPALVVDGANSQWDLSCDVLVIGFGAAGASAALAAQKTGAKVIVADRFDGGGASAKSGGIVYAGGGTPHQKKAGYEDTPEEMFKYLRMETGDSVTEPTLRQFCEDSRGLIEWLESMGANFESSAPPPKTSYPKDGIYLYYSGNEAVAEYAAVAKPAPRGHRTRGSWLSGKAMFEFLRAEVSRVGINTMTQTAVRRLITDKDGKVLGAELWQLTPGSKEAIQHDKLIQKAEKVFNFVPAWADSLRAKARAIEMAHAKPLRARANKGVILSAGGFIFNREMVAKYAPKYKMTMRLGTAGCDGSGIRLGQSVGAVADKLNHVSAWRFINPPIAWPKGIAINTKGERFCNEQVYGAKLGVEMCEFHDGKAWLILDKKLRKIAIREALFGGLWFFQSVPALLLMLLAKRGKTAQELGNKLGIDGAAFGRTIDAYNNAITNNTADPLLKSNDYRAALDTKLYALDIGAHMSCPAITLGGLRVDEKTGGVLNANGTTIPGLYAAGRTAIGVASNRYVSGLSLADCLWSGRRAGNTAANS